MKSFWSSFVNTLIVGLALTAAFLFGFYIRDLRESSVDLPILFEARTLLLDHGIKDPPAGPALEYGMIRGMLQAYGDPHTSFSEPAQHELSSDNLAGKFGGIGVEIQRGIDDEPTLLPLPDSPARIAGIYDGDILRQVDDLIIDTQTQIETIKAALRGEVGSSVSIIIDRPPDFQQHHFKIKRDEFSIPSVHRYLSPLESRLGIVKINLMAATTPSEIETSIVDLQNEGAQVFALDLRDNFGGLLTSGVDTARLFLSDGLIMEEQFKDGLKKIYQVEEIGVFSEIPLVILVNQNTASAAEIIAGALQARGRSLLIGTNTYGKDTVQLIFELQDKSSLAVTSAQWWIPTDNIEKPTSIQGNGLQPDIPVDFVNGNSSDPLVDAAIVYFFGED